MTATEPTPGSRSTGPSGDERPGPDKHRVAAVVVAACFLATLGAGAGLLIVYFLGGNTQVEGVLLALTLGGFGAGLVIWSHRLMPVPMREEERHSMASSAEMRAALMDELFHGGAMGRRRALSLLLAAGVVGLTAVVLVPLLSLGPRPGRSLYTTSWQLGKRIVDENGKVVQASDVPLDTMITVFPEGAVGAADSQAIMLHVDPETLMLDEPARSWAPNGFIVYSKLCTHAGCPVGLYLAATQHLTCPCHQSTFNVLDGAEPIYGPAARPLPQLPITMDTDETFMALSDFPEPVGPAFWDMGA